MKLWDGAGNAVRTFDALPDVALCTAFTHDDIRVIGGDWTGQVLMWTGAGGKAVGSMTPNPPTLADAWTRPRRMSRRSRRHVIRKAASDKAAVDQAAAAAAAQAFTQAAAAVEKWKAAQASK